jgi:hypothetical protein
MSYYIKVFRGSAIVVKAISYALEDQGISAIVKDPNESARLAGFAALGESTELYVLETDFERVQELIASFNESSDG